MKNTKVNICYWDNGGGLSLDAKIIAAILEEGADYKVFHNGFKKCFLKNFPKLRKFLWQVQKACLLVLSKVYITRFTISIHLETLTKSNLWVAKKNMMIANLEWLSEGSYTLLTKVDCFLAKTVSAKKFFDDKGLPVVYISFSSLSIADNKYQQYSNKFVHIAGKSNTKGTIPLIEVWAKHPEWPKLTVVVSKTHYIDTINKPSIKKFQENNLEIIEDYLQLTELRCIQNEAEIHLCLSEAEGFGHSICEAMSCGSIVITVDGSPMNELIRSDRGVLVKVSHEESMGYSRRFFFDKRDLERKLEEIHAMSSSEKNKLKLSAKTWFDTNYLFFKKALIKVVNEQTIE